MGKEILTYENVKFEFLPPSDSFFYYFFLFGGRGRGVDTGKVLVSNKISFSEKNYKYLIGYLYNDNKEKSIHIMLPKPSAYVDSNHTCLSVISLDSFVKKMRITIHKCF